jgi:hypothetical protein
MARKTLISVASLGFRQSWVADFTEGAIERFVREPVLLSDRRHPLRLGHDADRISDFAGVTVGVSRAM